MPLGRFRQVLAAIQTRAYHKKREEDARFSWMTRNLAAYIAAGYQIDTSKSPNTALEAAGKLTLDSVEEALLNSAPAPAKENAPGSFERFMGALGASGGKRPGQ